MPQHFEQRYLPYSPEHLFALVADIESYPDFLPWCLGARIIKRDGNIVTADLIVGYKSFREQFRSIVTLKASELISVRYDGGALKHMKNEWCFMPGKTADECNLTFYVDFSLRSSLLNGLMDMFFDKAFRKMVAAFEKRAAETAQQFMTVPS